MAAVALGSVFDPGRADVGAQCLQIATARRADEFVEDPVFANQSFAPAFCQMHGIDFVAMRSLAPVEQLLDGLRIDVAHELADELHLPPPSFVRAGIAHFDDGVGQAFG